MAIDNIEIIRQYYGQFLSIISKANENIIQPEGCPGEMSVPVSWSVDGSVKFAIHHCMYCYGRRSYLFTWVKSVSPDNTIESLLKDIDEWTGNQHYQHYDNAIHQDVQKLKMQIEQLSFN
jgi:hypothetical protein